LFSLVNTQSVIDGLSYALGFIVLIVIQEMNARMGIVTGKGLADLIRENAGFRVTFLIFVGLLIADIGNTTTEFAGVAGSISLWRLLQWECLGLAAHLRWNLAEPALVFNGLFDQLLWSR